MTKENKREEWAKEDKIDIERRQNGHNRQKRQTDRQREEPTNKNDIPRQKES